MPDGRATPDSAAILRDALEKLRLHGSLWWRDEWERPAKVAHDALDAADRAEMEATRS